MASLAACPSGSGALACGLPRAFGGIAVTTLAFPIVTSAAVQRAGKNRGVDAAYGATLVGSLGGMVAGAAVGLTPVLFAPRTEVAVFTIPALSFIGGIGGGVWANHTSARRRFTRGLHDVRPSLSVSDDRRGGVLALRGAF